MYFGITFSKIMQSPKVPCSKLYQEGARKIPVKMERRGKRVELYKKINQAGAAGRVASDSPSR